MALLPSGRRTQVELGRSRRRFDGAVTQGQAPLVLLSMFGDREFSSTRVLE